MAQDYTDQRRAVANKAVEAATRLVDALYDLQQLKDQRAKFDQDFQAADFDGVNGLKHLTTGMVGTLFDFVVPALQVVYHDTATYTPDGGNLGRNEQILQQVRKG